jgi:hypothetical protein
MKQLQPIDAKSSFEVQHEYTRPYCTSKATQVYSGKNNKEFDAQMSSTASRINPERSMSTSALKGLETRASHIPIMSDVVGDIVSSIQTYWHKRSVWKTEQPF